MLTELKKALGVVGSGIPERVELKPTGLLGQGGRPFPRPGRCNSGLRPSFLANGQTHG